jgi:formamidopyrimidine-DNA glycosylase
MPELPEVELVARSLRRWLAGQRVTAVTVLDRKLAEPAESEGWSAALVRQQCEGVERRAKYLLAHFTGGHTLVAHLRMTGRFVHHAYVTAPPKSERLRLSLEDGSAVGFQDTRRFGRIAVHPTAQVVDLPELASLGPDALLEPTSAQRLAVLCHNARRSIKTLLMDQRLIGGLGNICAIEILYRAGIAPDTPAGDLTEVELARIAALTPPYLEWAIERQSRRELLYIGEPGSENVFSIYRRAGEPCPACATPILRTVVAGRGTFHCPTCQPAHRESEESFLHENAKGRKREGEQPQRHRGHE